MTAGTSANAELARGEDQPPAGHHAILAVDQDRQDKTEPVKAFGQLAHLRRRMLARFAAQRFESRNSNKFGIEIAGDGVTVRARSFAGGSKHDFLAMNRNFGPIARRPAAATYKVCFLGG